MSECKLDHSQADVQSKLEAQSAFLPDDINELFSKFFTIKQTQDILNDVFHLLKKYDLASEAERLERNKQLYTILK